MTIERFEELVNEGIKAIPKEFLAKLDNVAIVIENEPSSEQLKKLKIGKNSFLFGLYQGIPKIKRWGYGQVLPDKITIFKNPIEKMAHSRERQRSVKMNEVHRLENEIREIVKNTVWHEIAHHFGLDEKEIRKVESRRRKT